MLDFFSYQFIQNAFWASILISVIAGFIGTYIVARRLVFLSGGITHASFGGIGIAWYLGINPILGAAIFSVLTALGLESLTKGKVLREDSAIGMFWSLGMAIGIFFVFLTPGYAPNLMSYLFGNILTISMADILLLLILAVVVALFFLLFYNPILFISFDQDYAQTQHVPARFIGYMLKILVALTIVFSIRAIGIILLISLLTIPANIANLFTKRFSRIITLSGIIGFLSIVLGILLSYRFNVPSGATIIIALMFFYAIAKIVTWCRLATFRGSLKV
ncbi:MAG: metal ABC transporter permease [Bacteroidales bacterium]